MTGYASLSAHKPKTGKAPFQALPPSFLGSVGVCEAAWLRFIFTFFPQMFYP
jgi:hypothetical protein